MTDDDALLALVREACRSENADRDTLLRAALLALQIAEEQFAESKRLRGVLNGRRKPPSEVDLTEHDARAEHDGLWLVSWSNHDPCVMASRQLRRGMRQGEVPIRCIPLAASPSGGYVPATWAVPP